MSDKLKALTLSASGVCVIVVFAMNLSAVNTPEKSESTDRALASGATTQPQGQSPAKFELEAGKRYVYSFERFIEIRGLASKPAEIRYQGKLVLDILKKSGSTVTILAKDSLNPSELTLELSQDNVKLFKSEQAKTSAERQSLNVLKDLISQWAFFPQRRHDRKIRSAHHHKRGQRREVEIALFDRPSRYDRFLEARDDVGSDGIFSAFCFGTRRDIARGGRKRPRS